MSLSARNRLKGTIKNVKLGTVMAEVVVEVGDFEVIAVITRDAAEEMKLQPGDTASAVVKATSVMIAKE